MAWVKSHIVALLQGFCPILQLRGRELTGDKAVKNLTKVLPSKDQERVVGMPVPEEGSKLSEQRFRRLTILCKESQEFSAVFHGDV